MAKSYNETLAGLQENGIASLREAWGDISNQANMNLGDDVSLKYRHAEVKTKDLSEKEVVEFLKAGLFELHKKRPAWSSTLLSLWYASPLLPGVFDQLIIDEASQCDVISIIPAMYRAKRAVFIGDPEQFEPIFTMTMGLHSWILKQYMAGSNALSRFQYYNANAYDVMKPIKGCPFSMLKEHFRCASGIASYFGNAFYGGQLRYLAKDHDMKFPKYLECKDSIQWIDVPDDMDKEIEQVAETYKKLVESCYEGTIGIICPIRQYTDDIIKRLQNKQIYDEQKVMVNTSYKFQGGRARCHYLHACVELCDY